MDINSKRLRQKEVPFVTGFMNKDLPLIQRCKLYKNIILHKLNKKLLSSKCNEDQAKMIIPFLGDAMDNLFSELTNDKICKNKTSCNSLNFI